MRYWCVAAAIYCAMCGALPPTSAHSAEKANDQHPLFAPGKPYGLTERVQWTTSHVQGSPEPPDPYRTERAYPLLRFDRPLDITISPDGKRWLVCEDVGTIQSFPVDDKSDKADLFLDIRRKDHRYLGWWEQRRIWSIAFHPDFQSNGYVFVCYIDPKPQPMRCRISRFTVDVKNMPSPLVADADSEYLVLEWISAVDHHGGCLKFGPDGYLYFPAGDGSGIADGNNSGQDLSDLNAAVMRIDVNGTENGRAYRIPKDNPFVNLPGARGEIWAYGTRNIWKMSFDRATGDLWGGDVGQDLWDMIYRIEKGGNYGWSVTEGTHPFLPDRKRGPTPILKPVVEHEHSEARSITGGYVYRGEKLPELVGAYIYGDYDTGKIWGVRYDGKQVTWHQQLADTALRIVCFGQDADGELVILDYTGTLHRLIKSPKTPAANAAKFPRLLSETGLFKDVKRHLPADGLIPYDVNSPLWSDGAQKERFIAVPGAAKIEYSPTSGWKFPEGSVLVKTFALELEAGRPESRKRLETRLLHLEQDHWRGYVYLWNDEQTDATLLDKNSLERKYTIRDAQAAGGSRQQVWHFPSRAECTLCHTMPANFVLGLSTVQMNRDHDYGGVVDNQLRALDHIGMFTKPIADYYKRDKASKPTDPLPSVPLLADPRDPAATLDARARSYLHANCAHCHMRWGGGNAEFQLLSSLRLEETGTINVPGRHGASGIEKPVLIAPGEPDRSLVLRRMELLDATRMPRVSSTVVDADAVQLIRSWIEQLGAKQ